MGRRMERTRGISMCIPQSHAAIDNLPFLLNHGFSSFEKIRKRLRSIIRVGVEHVFSLFYLIYYHGLRVCQFTVV